MSDLSSVERLKIEALFGMESGYVLGFSNNTFSMFTVTNVGIDIFDSKYEYGSSSKANRLRKFWLEESNEVVRKLLSALLDYWLAQKQINEDELSPKEKTLYDECQKIVTRLNQDTFRQTQENTFSLSQKRGIFSNGTDMTDTKRLLKVFLCHAHADRDSVRGLYVRLTQDGVDAWFDKAKLLPGQDWELEIRKAVREADVVVVCLSKQFNQAGFRQKEVRLALDTAMEKPEGEIFIIPARLEECDNLESLRKWHWVDLFEGDGYEMLMYALRARANKIGASLKIISDILPGIVEKPTNSKKNALKVRRKINVQVVVSLIGIFVVFSWILNFTLIKKWRAPVSVLTPVSTLVSGVKEKNALTPEAISEIDSAPMIYIPAGRFLMGSNRTSDEQPVHSVYISAYWIDKYEISNRNFDYFVSKTGYKTIAEKSGQSDVLMPGDNNFYYWGKVSGAYWKVPWGAGGGEAESNHPVVHIARLDAEAYCNWAGRRLPTEAEWEKAARGEYQFLYPWGNSFDTSLNTFRLNYCDSRCKAQALSNQEDDGYQKTSPIGSYPNGASPYGVLDMSGNVWEWVQDWYNPLYYSISLANDPAGPEIGEIGILRGGSWSQTSERVTTTARQPYAPDYSSDDFGFRCVLPVE